MQTGRCWNCKKFEEHFYWDHVEETNLRFMKVMEGDFSHEMEFPRKFANKFRVDLPDMITLKASNGDLWNISLFKEEDHFYLKDGWKVFIDAHGIKEGYSIFFKYAGNSTFTVKFFDQTGCFRDTYNFSRCSKNEVDKVCQKRQSVDEAARNLKGINLPQSKSVGQKRQSVDEAARNLKDSKFSDGVASCKRRLGERAEDQEVRVKNEMMENSEDILKKLRPPYVYRTGDSFFVKVMMRSHLCFRPFLTIPSGFIFEHFHIKPKRIILCKQKEKKRWIVNCKFRNISFGLVGKSLRSFFRENNLMFYDVCIFTLINSCGPVLDVRIISSAEAESMRKSCLV